MDWQVDGQPKTHRDTNLPGDLWEIFESVPDDAGDASRAEFWDDMLDYFLSSNYGPSESALAGMTW